MKTKKELLNLAEEVDCQAISLQQHLPRLKRLVKEIELTESIAMSAKIIKDKELSSSIWTMDDDERQDFEKSVSLAARRMQWLFALQPRKKFVTECINL